MRVEDKLDRREEVQIRTATWLMSYYLPPFAGIEQLKSPYNPPLKPLRSRVSLSDHSLPRYRMFLIWQAVLRSWLRVEKRWGNMYLVVVAVSVFRHSSPSLSDILYHRFHLGTLLESIAPFSLATSLSRCAHLDGARHTRIAPMLLHVREPAQRLFVP
ncbi:hypothetical protein GGS23DRAFT_308743 [Durotheca rogersii]|uniref:uncharacterized protein n=1 Tax=Durotheca rogersii TaxID=419775 RepID=UPI00221E7AB5|nr:uncharacterized protein GGS23DRAFT_308743 [Durotheca rogersii]KAI5859654.1 hypothetical protein GGS23DRAFT_308743 [Durotheca rogersii]